MSTSEAGKPFAMNQMPEMKMESSHYDEDRTVYHGRPRETPSAKFLRRAFQVLLFGACMGVMGGIIMGVVAIHNVAASAVEKDEGAEARQLFVRSYYDNLAVSGIVNPTGSTAIRMDNATVAMGTASSTVSASANSTWAPVLGTPGPSWSVIPSMGNSTVVRGTGIRALSSTDSPLVTATAVDDIVTVAAVDTVEQPSTVVEMPIVNVTTTVTSTSTTVTSTRTVTPTGAVTVASMVPPSGETPPVYLSTPANDCVPVTVTQVVTETIGFVPGANVDTTPGVVPPFTTITVSALNTKTPKVCQATDSPRVPNVATKIITVTLSATETVFVTEMGAESVNAPTPAPTAAYGPELNTGTSLATTVGDDQTTTITVFEQATVFITSTSTASPDTSCSPVDSTNTASMAIDGCVSGNVTVASVTPSATVTLSKFATETYTVTQGGSSTVITEVHTVFKTEVVGVEKTVFATGTVGALNSIVTPFTTVTVQPVNPAVTQAAPRNDSVPVVVSEGNPSNEGTQGSLSILGCVVMMAMSIFMI